MGGQVSVDKSERKLRKRGGEQHTVVYSHAGCLNSAKESVWFLLFVFPNHNFTRWTPFALKKKGGGAHYNAFLQRQELILYIYLSE